MSFQQKALDEIKSIGLLAAYFAGWISLLMLLKKLMLEDYQIQFRGISVALISALVVAKVVALMEYVPLGQWVQRRPVAVDVVLRTLLYTFGVFIVMLLEKAFEARHEAGGFGKALVTVFQHRDMPHVWAGTICIGGSVLGFMMLSALQRHFGAAELKRLFFATPLAELEAKETTQTGAAPTQEAR
jgi:hypothetical protein